MLKTKDLLNDIAREGYNVGFGSKVNFSTYDIITKAPVLISILVTIIGILGLGWPFIMNKCVSIILLIIGILAFAIEHFCDNPVQYKDEGERENKIFYELKGLYREVESKQPDEDCTKERETFNDLKNRFQEKTIAKQIFFSNWYAHFKFFVEYDSDWIVKELNLKLWKDKIPGSFKVCVLSIFVLISIITLSVKFCPLC